LDVHEYFLQKEKEFEDCGAVPDDPKTIFRAEKGADGKRGIVKGTLGLHGDAVLNVYERIVVRGDRPTRETYCYALVINGIHVYRWERDPRNHPDDPVHEHKGAKEIRQPNTKPISLKKALTRAWGEISLQAEAPLDDDD